MLKHAIQCTIAVCLVIFAVSTSRAQSVNAYVGDVYGPYPGNATVQVPGTEAVRGNFSGGGGVATSNGTLNAASSFGLNGNGIQLQLPVTFTPNGVGGPISGSFTATYNCSGSCTQTNLTITVNVTGTSYTGVATAGLKYQILSILYTPPGNASNNGFSSSLSAGQSVSTSVDFSNTDSIQFRGGAAANSNAVTFSSSADVGDISSSVTNYQATSTSQLFAAAQAIDHNQDQVYLLVDPSVTVTQTGPTAGYVTVGGSLDASGNFDPSGAPNDVINVNIAALKNPPLIPLSALLPQTPAPGVTLPGLSYLCATPLPPAQCTQENACGCTSADFAPIVAQDALANVTDQTTPPDSLDPTRYVYVNYISLQGPDQPGAGPVRNGFSLSDSTINGYSTNTGSSYGVAYSHGFGFKGFGFDLGITATDGFTFKQSRTVGTTNGTAHTGSVTLGTSNPGCFEYVSVYEDTIYHTFAFSLPQPAPAVCQ